MTKTRSTKRALLMSTLSLLLCVSMLVGSTFAWFTDSVTSAGNIIKSGNLDVTMEWYDGTKEVPAPDSAEWIDAADGAIFDYDLWEPGYTVVRHIKIANEGTLALKYQLNIIANGEVSKLADVIDVYYLDPAAQLSDRANIPAEKKLGTLSKVLAQLNTSASGNLEAGDEHTVTLALKMRESAGNAYQELAIGSTFSIQLLATQLTSEFDSFDDQYDKDAKYPGEVGTADELAVALANNESVKLLNDIALTGEWTPIGNKDEGIYYTGTLDGNGHTISGLSVTSGDYVALISAAKDATIKNLTVEGSVEGENAAGVVARVEGNTVIEDVTSNVTVKGTSKAGGITCNVTNSEKTVFTGCVNNGAVSGGDNGIGGIVGYANNDAYVEIIACENNADITSDNNKYAGAAVGYAAKSKGVVTDMKNTGTITGSLIDHERFLKYGDTVLCGYVASVGNWTVALSATPENVQSVVDNILEGATVQLSAGKYGTIVAKSNITIQGVPGAVVDCINLNGAENVTLKDITFDAAGAQEARDNSGTSRPYANIIGGVKDTAIGARNIVIDGCTFTGKFENAGAAIAFADRNRPTGGSGNITVKNCTFNTENANYDFYGYYTGVEGMTFTFENNVFEDSCHSGPIYLGQLRTSEAIVVNGNTFKTKATLSASVYVKGASGYTPTLSATGNTFAE